MSKLKLNIRIGANQKTVDPSVGASIIADEILGEMTSNIKNTVSLSLSKLAKNLPKVVENSYVDAVNYAAKSMIGTKSPRGADNRAANDAKVDIRDPDGEGLVLAKWQVLSPRTIKEQNQIRGTKSSGEFFNRTGQLRSDILSMARSMVKRTGVVRVQYEGTLRDARGRFTSVSRSTKKIGLGQFRITLMPNINRASLPGVISGNYADHNPELTFERKLGFSPQALNKLRGATRASFVIPGTHRPLLQPVFTYWTLNRIPNIIGRSITQSIETRKIDDSSGGFVGTIMR